MKKIGVIITLGVLLSACNGNSNSQNSIGNQSHSSDDITLTQSLDGQWANCESFDDVSYASVYRFMDNQFVFSFEEYANSDCTGKPSLQTNVYRGKLALGDMANQDAYSLDVEIETAYPGFLPPDDQRLVFDVIRINDKKLYFGNAPGNTKHTRSTSIDLETPYTFVADIKALPAIESPSFNEPDQYFSSY